MCVRYEKKVQLHKFQHINDGDTAVYTQQHNTVQSCTVANDDEKQLMHWKTWLSHTEKRIQLCPTAAPNTLELNAQKSTTVLIQLECMDIRWRISISFPLIVYLDSVLCVAYAIQRTIERPFMDRANSKRSSMLT